MKNIKISKSLWRELCKIKNRENYNNFSLVIQHILKEPEGKSQNFDEDLKEIEGYIDHLQSEKHIEETSLEAPLPNNIIFMCLMCGQPYELKRANHDAVQGIKCQNCGYFHLIQIYSWLPSLGGGMIQNKNMNCLQP